MNSPVSWFENDLLERFRRYTAVATTSDGHNDTCPSTPGQWDLARILHAELSELGLQDVELTDFCYVRAVLKSTMRAGTTGTSTPTPTVGFLAHMDTSPDCSGTGVTVQVHSNYDGGLLRVSDTVTIDPATSPALKLHKGHTILTSNGTTLLGADDKAGVSEIMCAVRWLVTHPEIQHGDIEIIFTPDEEIGRGVEKIPRDKMKSQICYTLDGDEEGTYNAQCFNGWTVEVVFRGKMIHPGDGRGRLVNPVAMAGMFIANVPRTESPEATDGNYGYYCPQEIKGNMEETRFVLFIRDFDRAQIERRLAYLHQLAATVEGAFPGGTATVTERKQYLNMFETIQHYPQSITYLEKAIRDTGIEPQAQSIRGGTDGARLSELGIPTPNIFAGGHNFHSVQEWVPLQSMVRAALVVVNLAQLWATHEETKQ